MCIGNLSRSRPFYRSDRSSCLSGTPDQDDRAVGGRRGPDNIFRPFAPLLQKQLGQPVVIANVGGASGTKGAKEAKDSLSDGYTLYSVHEYIHSTYYTGVADINYTDFEPICLISSTPSGTDRESQDALEGLEGAARGRQGPAWPDHGRRHARLDQPFFPRL